MVEVPGDWLAEQQEKLRHTMAELDELYRGRECHCWHPPAQIRTCPIRASGSYLGCLTAKRSLGQG
jgi:hypothetical protein